MLKGDTGFSRAERASAHSNVKVGTYGSTHLKRGDADGTSTHTMCSGSMNTVSYFIHYTALPNCLSLFIARRWRGGVVERGESEFGVVMVFDILCYRLGSSSRTFPSRVSKIFSADLEFCISMTFRAPLCLRHYAFGPVQVFPTIVQTVFPTNITSTSLQLCEQVVQSQTCKHSSL